MAINDILLSTPRRQFLGGFKHGIKHGVIQISGCLLCAQLTFFSFQSVAENMVRCLLGNIIMDETLRFCSS